MEKEYFYDNIKIAYTKENETADNYIEKFVNELGNTHMVRVATLDYPELTMILKQRRNTVVAVRIERRTGSCE